MQKPGLLAGRDLRSRKRASSTVGADGAQQPQQQQPGGAPGGDSRGGSSRPEEGGGKKPRGEGGRSRGTERSQAGPGGAGGAAGGRWRTSRMAEDYVNMVGDLMYPRHISYGTFGYDTARVGNNRDHPSIHRPACMIPTDCLVVLWVVMVHSGRDPTGAAQHPGRAAAPRPQEACHGEVRTHHTLTHTEAQTSPPSLPLMRRPGWWWWSLMVGGCGH